MAIRRQAGSVFVVVAFLFQLLTLTPSARSQAPADAAQALPQTTASGAATGEQRLRWYVTRVRYAYFLEFAGRENYLIEKERKEGRQSLAERIDFGLAIDISEGEEQVMMSIILDASPQVISAWDQVDGISTRLLQSTYAPDEMELTADYKKLFDLAGLTRTNLKRELGLAFIKKLDAYVNREFNNREGPLSLAEARQSEDVHLEGSGATNLHPYSTLFQVMGGLDQADHRIADAMQRASSVVLPLYIPKEHREAVLAIFTSAQLQIRQNLIRENATIGEYFREHGPQPIPRPTPSEFYPVWTAFWANVSSNVIRLKQLLGESEFKKFDESVNQVFGVGLSAGGRD